MNTAFASPVTVGIVAAAAAVVVCAAAVIALLSATGRASPALVRELWLRTGSWAVLLPCLMGPVLWGRVPTILLFCVLGLLCLREYDRATGLFRDWLMSGTVALGVLFVTATALDRWYGLFVASIPLTAGALAVVSLPADRPAGYVQRTGLALFAFMLFGAGLGHFSLLANDVGYRPVLLLLLTTVALNDVFAFTAGKLLGGPKLLPATSPNKTVSGAVGAMACTTAVVAPLAAAVFHGSPVDRWPVLIGLGLVVSIAGQAGDLVLSSIKRDLGIKDMGTAIPGHGGWLDRFNSLLLVAPASFYYIDYFGGFVLLLDRQ